MSVGIDFFATRDDLIPGLKVAETQQRLQYVLLGMFESPVIEPIFSALAIEDLGIIKSEGRKVFEKAYLVFDAATELKVTEIPQRRGGVLYSIDLVANPTGFGFRPGGLFEGCCLIRGSIGTATGNPISIALCRAFARAVRKGFTKIYSYYVGPEAERLLDEGMRLAIGAGSSPDSDLKR